MKTKIELEKKLEELQKELKDTKGLDRVLLITNKVINKQRDLFSKIEILKWILER